jgi:hypothetical protein
MKIAVCLSGQPRHLDLGIKNILDVFSQYNVDYFVHTWWDDNFKNQKSNINGGRSFVWKENSLEKIMNKLSPKLLYHEVPKIFETYDGVNYETLTPNSVHSMFYSIKIANELKKTHEKFNNFVYDIVIRCRFDIEFHSFNLNLKELDYSKIYTYHTGIEQLPNDQFAISNSSNMDYYSQLYDNLKCYYDEGFTGFIGERLLNYHLRKKNLTKFTNDNELINNIIKI